MKVQKKKPAASTPAPVVVRLPKTLINALDKAALKNCRSRSSEVKSRLLNSLAAEGRS